MRELFEICEKYSFLTFLVLSELWGGGVNLVRKGEKWCILMCQGQPGKIPCLSPEKMTIFPHLALFFHLSLPKMWPFHPR